MTEFYKEIVDSGSNMLRRKYIISSTMFKEAIRNLSLGRLYYQK